jgi:hypothetical protein
MIAALTLLPLGAAHASDPKPADKGMTGDEMWQAWCATQQPFRPLKPLEVLNSSEFPSRYSYIVCADATNASAMTGPSTWNRIDFPLPHSAVLLLVHGQLGSPVTWRLSDGTRGWTAAGIDSASAAGAADVGPDEEGTAGMTEEAEATAILELAADLVPNDTEIKAVADASQRGGANLTDVRAALERAPTADLEEGPAAALETLIERTYSDTATSVVNLHRFQPGEVGIELSIDPRTPGALTARVDTLRAHTATLAAALDQAANKHVSENDGSSVVSALRTARADLIAASDRLDAANDVMGKRTTLEGSSTRAQLTLIDALDGKVDEALQLVRALETAPQPPTTPDPAVLTPIIQEIDAITNAIAAIPDPRTIVLPTLVVEPAYTGAIKVGVGVAWVPMYADFAVGQANVAGSDGQQVVQRVGGGPLALDATLAYSHYLSRRPASNPGLRTSVTGGIAIASLTDQKVSALDMLYLGIEYGAPNLSTAFVLQARTTEILHDELSVGAPVDSVADDDSIVRKGVTVGFGVILHPAPVLASVGGKKS